MYKTKILIISRRKELSIKYKKMIEALNQNVEIVSDLSNALKIIQKQEIEFIIISDTIQEKLSDFVKKIRVLTYNFRPIIVAVSKSGDVKDKIEILEAGADDFIGEEISKQELKVRFKAHLRRYIESFLNPITKLPDKTLTLKAIKKTILQENNSQMAYLLIKIRAFEIYRKKYGEIAYEKVLQTLSALIASTLNVNDFVGHILDNELILITNKLQAEKIASFLVFAFDNILSKFYSQKEFDDNFTIQTSDNVQEIKEYLMRLNIVALEHSDKISNFQDVLNNLQELLKLCNSKTSSIYVIDRIKLNGEVNLKEESNNVLILEPDEALSCLIKNVCQLSEIDVQISSNEEEFLLNYEKNKPNLVVLDWFERKNASMLSLANKVTNDNVKLIFTSSLQNKKEVLKAGADLYIPKPYEISDLIDWIKKFLK